MDGVRRFIVLNARSFYLFFFWSAWRLIWAQRDQNSQTRPNKASDVKIDSLKARSSVQRAAEIHATISGKSSDILCVYDKWFQTDTSDTITFNIAQPNYSVVGIPRSDERRWDGLAVIYLYYYIWSNSGRPTVRTSNLRNSIRRSKSWIRTFYHRQPVPTTECTSVDSFLDEFEDLLDAIVNIGRDPMPRYR